MLNWPVRLLGLHRPPIQTAVLLFVISWTVLAIGAIWLISPGPRGVHTWPRFGMNDVPDTMPVYCDLGGHRGWTYGAKLREVADSRTDDGWYLLPTTSDSDPKPGWLSTTNEIVIPQALAYPGHPHMGDEEYWVMSVELLQTVDGTATHEAGVMRGNGALSNITQQSSPGRVRPTGLWNEPDSYQILFGGTFWGILFLTISTPIALAATTVGLFLSGAMRHRRGSSSGPSSESSPASFRSSIRASFDASLIRLCSSPSGISN